MDYEKKYKNLLAKAKEFEFQGYIDEECLYDMFPELKESEDEMIRQALIRFHKSTIDVDGIKGAEIVSWLEKQGEPTEINPSEFDSQLNRLLKQFESLSKENIASSLSFHLNVVQNEGTYKEENQDEQETLCEKCKKEQPSHSCQDITALGRCALEKQGKTYPILSNSSNIGKPTWSEEDETVLNNLIYALANDRIGNDRDEYISLLKSLKEIYTWKPSEEQMGVIEAVINNRSFQRRHLDSLYEQLKKLSGE